MNSYRRRQLKQAYDRFLLIPFPMSSDDPELREIHDDLVLYDSNIAGYISCMIDGKPIPLDKLKYDEQFEIRLRTMETTKRDPTIVAQIQEYKAYLQLLRALIAIACRYTESNRSGGE